MDKVKIGYPIKVDGTSRVPNRPDFYWIKMRGYPPLAVFNRTVTNLDISQRVIIKEVDGILEIERQL